MGEFNPDDPIVIAPQPENTCASGMPGCRDMPDDIQDKERWNQDDLPDRLCAEGQWGCGNRDAGRIDTIDDLPDKLCANGQFGCHDFDDQDSEHGGSVINIFDDFFNSAVGLKTTLTALAVGSSSAFILAF